MIPAGWKLVPVEPTQEMLSAAHTADREYTDRNFGDVMTVQQGPYDHYVAMLEAAPTPPAQQDDEALELLRLALDALTCDHTGDDIADSHRCGKCDENVDRNANVRQRIRALLTKRGAA